jgi:hypothetical protein
METITGRLRGLWDWWNGGDRTAWLVALRQLETDRSPISPDLAQTLPSNRAPDPDHLALQLSDQWVYWVNTGNTKDDGHYIMSLSFAKFLMDRWEENPFW